MLELNHVFAVNITLSFWYSNKGFYIKALTPKNINIEREVFNYDNYRCMFLGSKMLNSDYWRVGIFMKTNKQSPK